MIGYRVKHERIMLGMTQKELADHIGVAPSTINALENNSFDSRLSIAIKLKNALGYKTVEQLTKPLTEEEKQSLISILRHRQKLRDDRARAKTIEYNKRRNERRKNSRRDKS